MSIPSCLHYCSSVIKLDVRDGDTSGRFFYCTGSFWLSFFFPYEVDYFSFKVCEELCWDFDGYFIESIDCFWQDCHFQYVEPTYPRILELFPFSGIFFNFFLQRKFLINRPFTSSVSVTPRYFMLFVSIVKGDISLVCVVGFMLRSLIYLDVSFLHGSISTQILILQHVDIQLCQHLLLNILSFFHFILFACSTKIQCSYMHGLNPGLCWIPLVLLSFYANTRLFLLLWLYFRV